MTAIKEDGRSVPYGGGSSRCRVCKEILDEEKFRGKVLEHSVRYYECARCGYVQTEEPFWLEQAYAQVINDTDVGLLHRNLTNTKVVITAAAILGELHGRVVDYAGGYGVLVRLLRDAGVEAHWHDPYCQNLFAGGFEYKEAHARPAALVTAFEAFEHFLAPLEELRTMLRIAPNVLLSTKLIPDPAPPQDEWWYYGAEHGQHIGLFRLETLKYLAATTGKYLSSDGHDYHLFSDRPLNRAIWRMALRLSGPASAVLRRSIRSKTQEDFTEIRRSGGSDK